MEGDEATGADDQVVGALVRRQQEQLSNLSFTVENLERRVTALETALRLQHRIAPATAITSLRDIELATRDALRHIDDTGYLSDCRLAHIFEQFQEHFPGEHALQSCLYEAIRLTQPAAPWSDLTHACRHREILSRTYVDGRTSREIAGELGISRRQYYRELKLAVLAVACQILPI